MLMSVCLDGKYLCGAVRLQILAAWKDKKSSVLSHGRTYNILGVEDNKVKVCYAN